MSPGASKLTRTLWGRPRESVTWPAITPLICSCARRVGAANIESRAKPRRHPNEADVNLLPLLLPGVVVLIVHLRPLRYLRPSPAWPQLSWDDTAEGVVTQAGR